MDGKMTRRMEEGGAVHHGRQMYKRGSWRTRANHLAAAVGGSGITFFLALAIIITPADPADETEASAARFIRSVIVVSRFLVRGRRVTGAG